MAALFSTDATIISAWGRVAKSNAEIETLFVDELTAPNAPLEDTTLSLTITSWRPLGPGHAFVDADADVAAMEDPDGKAMPVRHHMSLVLEKKADKWLVTDARAYFFTPPMAKPASAPVKK